MKVDILPLSLNALPNSGLFGITRHGILCLWVNLLCESNVGNNSRLAAQHALMGSHQGGGALVRIRRKLKVVLVKGDSFNKVALGFRLKARHRVIDQSFVGVKILGFDRVEKILRQGNEVGSRGHGAEGFDSSSYKVAVSDKLGGLGQAGELEHSSRSVPGGCGIFCQQMPIAREPWRVSSVMNIAKT